MTLSHTMMTYLPTGSQMVQRVKRYGGIDVPSRQPELVGDEVQILVGHVAALFLGHPKQSHDGRPGFGIFAD